MVELVWLPHMENWREELSSVAENAGSEITAAAKTDIWNNLVRLANVRLGFAETLQLDRVCQRYFAASPPAGLATKPVRLAILSSSTSEHLLPGLRVGALRRGIWLSTYTTAYGQYMQALLDPNSALHSFKPTAVLFAFDAAHLLGESDVDTACETLATLWQKARDAFGCEIFQQTLLPVAPALLGSNEHRLPNALRQRTARMNERLRALADTHQAHLVAIDDHVLMDGLAAWHDPLYWHKAKQEINPLATPMYGDIVARLLAASQGRSFKCLVLDLDNTLWGGVIGDDGLEGIKLGQGSALGEAYLAIQRYAHDLSRRGIILAVCSKNEEANALAPFTSHPEMLLRREDIACFVANWNDKASNLRLIAQQLNIGLDALVFMDDNPFERNIVRQELPMVAVPELPDDSAHYVRTVAAAGYFESLSVTPDDLARAEQYQANAQRESLKASSIDLAGYLKSLAMELHAAPFDAMNLARIVQLINKTNQFNLTTRRYTEAEVQVLMRNPQTFTLQLRLTDKFGDNGIIGVVIGIGDGSGGVVLDSWLMSCRVLGRGVEAATLNLAVEQARKLGAQRLIGIYSPTAKNEMVRDHYARLGFTPDAADSTDGMTRWTLALKDANHQETHIALRKAA